MSFFFSILDFMSSLTVMLSYNFMDLNFLCVLYTNRKNSGKTVYVLIIL